MTPHIRPAQPHEWDQILGVIAAAFNQAKVGKFAEAIRASDRWIEQLSLVAECDAGSSAMSASAAEPSRPRHPHSMCSVWRRWPCIRQCNVRALAAPSLPMRSLAPPNAPSLSSFWKATRASIVVSVFTGQPTTESNAPQPSFPSRPSSSHSCLIIAPSCAAKLFTLSFSTNWNASVRNPILLHLCPACRSTKPTFL